MNRQTWPGKGSGQLDRHEARGCCHANVGGWCRFKPGHKAIRGWFVIDIPALRKTLLVSHSIVEDEQGRRFDPTPRRFHNQYPFLEDDDPLCQLRNYYRNLRSVTHEY